jgi:NhaA family Na+:H+ antiporter
MAAIHERKAAEHRRIAELKTAERLAEVAGGAGEEDDRRA